MTQLAGYLVVRSDLVPCYRGLDRGYLLDLDFTEFGITVAADFLDFIPKFEDAKRAFNSLRAKQCGHFELLACNVSNRVIVDFDTDPAKITSVNLKNPDNRLKLSQVISRIRTTPPTLEGTFLGYDVTYFSGDFYSAVYQYLIRKQSAFERLNDNGLLPTMEAAEGFLQEYLLIPENQREHGYFCTYEVRSIDIIPNARI